MFGALISPTDPIAVIGILQVRRCAEEPRGGHLERVAVQRRRRHRHVPADPGHAHGRRYADGRRCRMAARPGSGIGGIAFGALLGYVTYRLLKSIDSHQEEVLLTLAAVMGGYTLAARIDVSGPLAMVTAGLIIGHQGRALAMSDKTRLHIDMFWELFDAILNSVLFMLIGMQVIVVAFPTNVLVASAGAILIVLSARLVSVAAPIVSFKRAFRLPRGAWQVLTWGGLRGGISVALVLALPPGPESKVLLAMTSPVVVFHSRPGTDDPRRSRA